VKNKKILLIAFRFPPMGGVGSRRWAKFSKILARRGYEIHVITIKYPYVDKVNWSYDVAHPNIITHRINAGIPSIILKESKNKAESLIVYLFNRLCRPLLFYLDNAQRWYKYLLPYAKNLIRGKNIKNVIVTGPPNSLHYFTSFLKIENPLLNLIHDFRDPWNDDIVYEYKTYLNFFWQKERSVRMEDFVFLHADKIIFVTEDMKARYSKIYPIFRDKFYVIHNGYDKDDLDSNITKMSNLNRSLNLVYVGSLGLGREKAIPLLAEAIELQKNELHPDFQVDIYSEKNLKDFNHHPSYHLIKKYIYFHAKVNPQKIQEIILPYYCGLTINSEIYPYAFGTKVFDYMVSGKKIFLISNGGELYDYLKKKGCFAAGYSVSEIASELKKLKADFINSKNSSIEYPEFDLQYLTSKVESLLLCD